MGPDLTSKRWIVVKGLLFALLVPLSGIPLVFAGDQAIGIRALLLLVCIWASCRFYYFLFHVLHAYVDPTLPSAGVMDLLATILRRWRK